MIVPGIRVVPWDKKEMILRTEKMRSLKQHEEGTIRLAEYRDIVLRETHSSPLCCTVCPLRLLSMVIFPISSIWDAWTKAGPIGQARSKDFEYDH
jgi:hypothetical protein